MIDNYDNNIVEVFIAIIFGYINITYCINIRSSEEADYLWLKLIYNGTTKLKFSL